MRIDINKNQILLLFANIILVFFLILLSNLNVLPLHIGDFIFFSIITLALALYRPGWIFLFFVGMIMLENINLAPLEMGIAIRPYQFFGGLLIVALVIRLTTNRSNFKLIKLDWHDWMVIVFGIASFISSIFSVNINASFKQSIILASFIFLYFLVRNYIQTQNDLKKIIPFFLSSSIVAIGYGVWQNIQFMRGAANFETMPGRPNATFMEADWLGIYLVLLLAVAYSLIFYLNKKDRGIDDARISNSEFLIFNQVLISKSQIVKSSVFIFLTLIFISLILTVSRSAWLGAFGVTFIFLLTFFTQLKISPKNWQWREMIWMKVKIISAIIISIAIVYIFSLTNFQLGNRVQSTGTGLQEITVSCENGTGDWKSVSVIDPLIIENIDELEQHHCRHINLEDIDREAASGRFIATAFRKDPNFSVRGEIYKKSWEIIKDNPILGIGWGSISSYLGNDERGAGLNASNIFLEAWLGSGIWGLLSFVVLWIFIFVRAIKIFMQEDLGTKTMGVFMLLGILAILIPNLFNSGIMLGFLWLFLGVVFIDNKK